MIVWLSTLSVDVAPLVALPLFSITAEPKFVPSILNWTVPVGLPAPGATGATVAVNLTDCPDADGFCDDVTVVVVLAWFTTCDSAVEVLPAKLESPP
jgi:hypothetical protein